MTITITITGDARTVRNELHELIGASRIYELPEPFRDQRAAPAAPPAEPTEPPSSEMPPAGVETPSDAPEAVSGEVIPPEKPKARRGRPTKAEAEERQFSGVVAEYQAAMAAEADPTPMSAAEAEKVMAADAVPETTLADVQNAIRDVAMRFDTDACKELLKQFGAGKSSEVKAEDRAAFVKAAREFKR